MERIRHEFLPNPHLRRASVEPNRSIRCYPGVGLLMTARHLGRVVHAEVSDFRPLQGEGLFYLSTISCMSIRHALF